jgi:hypothetical protein
MTIRVASIAASALPLLFLASGCGPSSGTPGKVYGKVTYKGAPVTGGGITLQTKDGAKYGGAIDPDGTYSVPDLPPGDMTVTISTENLNPNPAKPTIGPPGGGTGFPPGGGPPGPSGSTGPPGGTATPAKPQGTYMKIPEKYGDPQTSGLTVTVPAGPVKKDFDLKD